MRHRRERVHHKERARGSSHGYHCRRLVVGFRMDRLEEGRDFVHREIAGEELRRDLESVLEKDRVRHMVVEGSVVGRGFVNNLGQEDRRCCPESIEVVEDMVEVGQHRMADVVGRGFGFHHHKSPGLTLWLN